MGSIDLETFATAFQTEAELRGAIADLLMQLPSASEVKITHGAQEYGKDIVFKSRGGLLESTLCACVIKNTKITGSVDSSTGAMTVLHQVKQCLTHPYLNSKGEEERINRVYVISPFDCSQISMKSIEGELEHRSGQVVFSCGQDLLGLFETYLPGFLLLQSGFLTKYLSVLKQQLDDDNALSHLAFKHGILANAKKGTARVYVRPQFHKELAQFELTKIAPIKADVLSMTVGHATLQEFQAALDERAVLIRSLGQSWESPTRGGRLTSLARDLAQLLTGISDAWSLAYTDYVDACKSDRKFPMGPNQVSLRLTGVTVLKSAPRLLLDAQKAISDFMSVVDRANRYAKQLQTDPMAALNLPDITEYEKVMDSARPATSPIKTKRRGQLLRFPEDMLEHYDGDLMITAPAGYGKTSFCKWSALHDGERFAAGLSKTMPVYVPLHQLARGEITTFEDIYLRNSEILTMAQKSSHSRNDYRVRLYLDGLDEIPRERQAPLIDLAIAAKHRYKGMQIVLTARDHVFGPWLTPLPRISLSELSEDQVKQLVSALLDHDTVLTDEFFTQLKKVAILQPLIRIPLMGTLVVAVYRNMTTLPEGKAELYRIFVDLLCGGWDMAKGVKRESDFGSTLKLRVLMRLASVLHEARTRVGTAAPFKSVVNETAPVLSDHWEALFGDMIQDGLIIRNGPTFSFAHLSFQEYLAARDLADPTNTRRDEALRLFLDGDDWWSEVMAFYVAMSKRPRDMESWLRGITEQSALHSRKGDPREVRRRAQVLQAIIVDCSPAYRQ